MTGERGLMGIAISLLLMAHRETQADLLSVGYLRFGIFIWFA
jgi:hypothetical protein